MSDISLNLDPGQRNQPGYGDLLFVDGTLVLTSDANPKGTEPVMQNVLQRLNHFQGEWFLDQSAGTPWFQSILVRGQSRQAIDTVIQERILGTPGVAILLAYKSEIDDSFRMISVTFKIKTQAGVVADATVPMPLLAGESP